MGTHPTSMPHPISIPHPTSMTHPTSMGIPFLEQIDPSRMLPHLHPNMPVRNQQLQFDPSKAPGYRGPLLAGGIYPNGSDLTMQGNYKQQMVNEQMCSLQAQNYEFGHQLNDLDSLKNCSQEEYSTPNQPMTLPKIESTLNPNAPDFTSSRSAYLHPHHQHLLAMHQNALNGHIPGL